MMKFGHTVIHTERPNAMKHLSTAVLITALTILSIPMAIAAESTQATSIEQTAGEHHEDHAQRRIEHAQKNLDALQRQLHLKDNQQAGWSQYKSFVVSSLSEYAKGKENRRTRETEAREVESTPTRIQNLVVQMRERADKLDKLGKQTDTFYQTLSPEQKTIFDLHWKNRHSHQRWS
jgi:Spy/CpxP family protein refolding chaperone